MQAKQKTERNWGGRRRGAGRPKSGRRVGVAHRTRPRHQWRYPLHVTFRVRDDVPWLRAKIFKTVRRSVLRSQKDFFHVVEFSIQGRHVHLIVEANDRRGLERGMRGLGTRVAMAINRATGRRGRVFADRYFRRELRTTVQVRMTLAYVLNNHRKHGAADDGTLDPCSSAPWFTGWIGHQARAPSPLPRAETPLLATRWRRLGLLDRREGPNYHLMWNDPYEGGVA